MFKGRHSSEMCKLPQVAESKENKAPLAIQLLRSERDSGAARNGSIAQGLGDFGSQLRPLSPIPEPQKIQKQSRSRLGKQARVMQSNVWGVRRRPAGNSAPQA
jgi:hypothetical protein